MRKAKVISFSVDSDYDEALNEFVHSVKIKNRNFNQSEFIRDAVKKAMKEHKRNEKKGQQGLTFKLDEWVKDPETVALPMMNLSRREMVKVIQKYKGTKIGSEIRNIVLEWVNAYDLYNTLDVSAVLKDDYRRPGIL